MDDDSVLDADESGVNMARVNMQKAYVTYATVSSSAKSKDEKVEAAKWPKLVQSVAIEHQRLIDEMAEGKFYPNIDKDPRDN